jgi:hypothetical protein
VIVAVSEGVRDAVAEGSLVLVRVAVAVKVGGLVSVNVRVAVGCTVG